MKSFILAISAAFLCTAVPALAQQNSWRVEKVSGDVAIVTKTSTASASKDAVLGAGDAIRTGRNGRVLLIRGKESILVSPGSSITIPDAASDGLATTIAQQTGTILLDVEKRNVQHFEVETPYLAAVVKGTRFEVTVGSNGASVRVREGAVEVADLKSGQFALVSPGQTARVGQGLRNGLNLSGAGQRSSIQQGTPRPPRVAPINTRSASVGSKASSATRAPFDSSRNVRISKAVGAVKLDVDTATRGLLRSSDNTSQGRNQQNDSRPSRWNSNVDAVASLPPGRSTSVASGNAGRGNGSGAGSSSAGGNGNGNAYGLLGGNGVGKAVGLLRNLGDELSNRGRGRGRGRS